MTPFFLRTGIHSFARETRLLHMTQDGREHLPVTAEVAAKLKAAMEAKLTKEAIAKMAGNPDMAKTLFEAATQRISAVSQYSDKSRKEFRAFVEKFANDAYANLNGSPEQRLKIISDIFGGHMTFELSGTTVVLTGMHLDSLRNVQTEFESLMKLIGPTDAPQIQKAFMTLPPTIQRATVDVLRENSGLQKQLVALVRGEGGLELSQFLQQPTPPEVQQYLEKLGKSDPARLKQLTALISAFRGSLEKGLAADNAANDAIDGGQGKLLVTAAQEQLRRSLGRRTVANTPRAELNRQVGQIMMALGVSGSIEGDTVVFRAPATGFDKLINQFCGMVMVISGFKRQITGKMEEALGKTNAANTGGFVVPTVARDQAETSESFNRRKGVETLAACQPPITPAPTVNDATDQQISGKYYTRDYELNKPLGGGLPNMKARWNNTDKTWEVNSGTGGAFVRCGDAADRNFTGRTPAAQAGSEEARNRAYVDTVKNALRGGNVEVMTVTQARIEEVNKTLIGMRCELVARTDGSGHDLAIRSHGRNYENDRNESFQLTQERYKELAAIGGVTSQRLSATEQDRKAYPKSISGNLWNSFYTSIRVDRIDAAKLQTVQKILRAQSESRMASEMAHVQKRIKAARVFMLQAPTEALRKEIEAQIAAAEALTASSSIDQIDKVTKALNAARTSVESLLESLPKRRKEWGETYLLNPPVSAHHADEAMRKQYGAQYHKWHTDVGAIGTPADFMFKFNNVQGKWMIRTDRTDGWKMPEEYVPERGYYIVYKRAFIAINSGINAPLLDGQERSPTNLPTWETPNPPKA